MADASSPSNADAAKCCCKCGKDVSRRTRYKNRDGYWCRRCSNEDEMRKRGMSRQKGPLPIRTFAIIGIIVLALVVLLYLWLG